MELLRKEKFQCEPFDPNGKPVIFSLAHELLYHGVDTFAYLFAQLFSVTWVRFVTGA
jgi:hypothetical protein